MPPSSRGMESLSVGKMNNADHNTDMNETIITDEQNLNEVSEAGGPLFSS